MTDISPSEHSLAGEASAFAQLGRKSAARRSAKFTSSPDPLRGYGKKAKPAQTAKRAISATQLHGPMQILADLLLIVPLSILSGILYHEVFLGAVGPVEDFAVFGTVVAFLYSGTIRILEARHVAMFSRNFDRFRDSAVAWLVSLSVLVFLLFALKTGSEASRGAIFLFFAAGLLILPISRVFLPPALARVGRHASISARHAIIVGSSSDPNLNAMAAALRGAGLADPIVMTLPADCSDARWYEERALFLARLRTKARLLGHGDIFFCTTGFAHERMESLQKGLSLTPWAIYVVPDAAIAALLQNKLTKIGDNYAVEIQSQPMSAWQMAGKRAIDIVVSSLLIVFLLPLWIVTIAAIKLDSRGPVFFRQTRNGYRGTPFKILKFRTMNVMEDGASIRQALKNDPRVTRVGRFLRRSSIDELPQLFNVLKGEMSLVGPRPHAAAHDALYAKSIENYELRQHVKPGITGWAQAHGFRGETPTMDLMYRRIEMDLWYASHCSLLVDFEIFIRTIFTLLKQRNAY